MWAQLQKSKNDLAEGLSELSNFVYDIQVETFANFFARKYQLSI
jgi:hypothetical protein